jgi:hypothetical protein
MWGVDGLPEIAFYEISYEIENKTGQIGPKSISSITRD